MSLHLYICTQFCQAWHIHLQFNNIVSTLFNDRGLIEDNEAEMARPVRMSRRHLLFKSTSKL